MPSYKINLALIRDCPTAPEVEAALTAYGRPSDKELGVMDVERKDSRVTFTFFRSREAKVKRVNRATGAIEVKMVAKDDVFKAAIVAPDDHQGVLEMFDGSAKTIELMGEFLAGLEFVDSNPAVEPITLLLPEAIRKLQTFCVEGSLLQIVSAKVRGYVDQDNNDITGDFSAKLKTVGGSTAIEFINGSSGNVASVKVTGKKLRTLTKAAHFTLTPETCLRVNGNSDDELNALHIARQLAGVVA